MFFLIAFFEEVLSASVANCLAGPRTVWLKLPLKFLLIFLPIFLLIFWVKVKNP